MSGRVFICTERCALLVNFGGLWQDKERWVGGEAEEEKKKKKRVVGSKRKVPL